jgi:hypothetical protein
MISCEKKKKNLTPYGMIKEKLLLTRGHNRDKPKESPNL